MKALYVIRVIIGVGILTFGSIALFDELSRTTFSAETVAYDVSRLLPAFAVWALGLVLVLRKRKVRNSDSAGSKPDRA